MLNNYVIWIDADAFFYVDSKNICDIINANDTTNFFFSNDINNTNINTGVFIVKNTQYSIDFLNKWAYDEDLYTNNSYKLWFDQGILINMYDNNILDIKNKENNIIYSYGILQHFNKNEIEKLPTQPFIYHLAGKSKEERIKVSTNYYNTIMYNKEHNIDFVNLYSIKLDLIKKYESKDIEKEKYLDVLKKIVLNSNTPLEGNCFYHHTTLNLYKDLYTKQLNLFWCGT